MIVVRLPIIIMIILLLHTRGPFILKGFCGNKSDTYTVADIVLIYFIRGVEYVLYHHSIVKLNISTFALREASSLVNICILKVSLGYNALIFC